MQNRQTAVALLFLWPVFSCTLVSLSLLRRRVYHALLLVLLTTLSDLYHGWPLLDPTSGSDLEKLDRSLEALVCECPQPLISPRSEHYAS
jgi:hypothetical protein